jgi:hypothetical protein
LGDAARIAARLPGNQTISRVTKNLSLSTTRDE